MPTPKDNPDLLNEWKYLKEKFKMEENLSPYKIYERIASMYEVHRTTVQYWLDPSYRATRRLYQALHPEKFGQRGKHRPGRYHREPRRKPYNKLYKRFIRSLKNYIPQAFGGHNQLTTEQLSDNLAEIAEKEPKIGRPIHIKPQTLRKYVSALQHKLDNFPVQEVKPGVYKKE